MKTLSEIEQFAKENYVPIARKQTVEFILDYIKENNYHSFLEIGTAIGYTCIYLCTNLENLEIVTIEHDLNRVQCAKENFIDFNIEALITLVIDDAVYFETNKQFDLIFIDAAKKRNWFFVEKFSKNLKPNGTIIVDNLHLDDFWIGANKNKKKEYDLVNKNFREKIISSNKYDYIFREDIGDGIVLLKNKNT